MGRFLSSRLFHHVRDGHVTSSPVRGGQRIQECAASLFSLVILGRGAHSRVILVLDK